MNLGTIFAWDKNKKYDERDKIENVVSLIKPLYVPEKKGYKYLTDRSNNEMGFNNARIKVYLGELDHNDYKIKIRNAFKCIEKNTKITFAETTTNNKADTVNIVYHSRDSLNEADRT